MKRIPPEVLADIMLDACYTPSIDVKDWLRPQIRCSHVCRYWRDVALGTASLWSPVILTQSESISHHSYPELLDLAWTRVGSTAPLSLTLWLRPQHGERDTLYTLFLRAISVLDRVFELVLSIEEPESLWKDDDLAPLREGRELPLLRRLGLECEGVNIVCPYVQIASFRYFLPQFNSAASEARSLTYVTSASRRLAAASDSSFNFPRLEDLTLSDLTMSVDDIHTIISGAPYLDHLTLTSVSVSRKYGTPALPVLQRMPSTVSARQMSPDSVAAILRLDAIDMGLKDVSYTEPEEVWGFFSQLDDLLTLDQLSIIRRIEVDGLNLTIWDDAGKRRFVTLPRDSDAVWNMLADRKNIFETVEEWETSEGEFSSKQTDRGGFRGAVHRERCRIPQTDRIPDRVLATNEFIQEKKLRPPLDYPASEDYEGEHRQ